MKLLILLILLSCFTLPTHTQTSARVDSSIAAIKINQNKTHAQQIDQLRTSLADSGIYKRLDSIDYAYVVIHISGRGNRFITSEFYYTHADSAPAMIYNGTEVVETRILSFYQSYNETAKEQNVQSGISKREFKFVQPYRHGCLRPARSRARKATRARLNSYEVTIHITRSTGAIKTQTILPRRFHPFIIKMTGGKF